MIPRRMSFFWTGRMSWMRYLTIWSFCQHNPNWEVNLYHMPGDVHAKTWDSQHDSDIGYDGYDYFQNVYALDVNVIEHVPSRENMPPAAASDIFRWELLAKDAGFYADMDILWLRPLDPTYEEVKDCDAVFCLERGCMAIGMMASNGCELFGDVLKAAVAADGDRYQACGCEAVFNAFDVPHSSRRGNKTLDIMHQRYPDLRIGKLPSHTVYPFVWTEIDKIFSQDVPMDARAVGLHWFGGDRLSREMNLEITDCNWPRYENTFTSCLRNLNAHIQ